MHNCSRSIVVTVMQVCSSERLASCPSVIWGDCVTLQGPLHNRAAAMSKLAVYIMCFASCWRRITPNLMPLEHLHPQYHDESPRWLAAGSPGSNSSIGALPNSPGSPVAYSPTAAAAAAAAALHGHSMYNMSQPGMFSHSTCAGGYYQQDGLPGWQQGFLQGVGYGQPMRAYR